MSRTRIKLDFVVEGDLPWLAIDVHDFIEAGLRECLKEKCDGLYIEAGTKVSFTDVDFTRPKRRAPK